MIRNFPLENIHANPYQARQFDDPDAVARLARDILANGLIQIPRGRKDPMPAYAKADCVQLACGHERLAAFRMLAARDPRVMPAKDWAEMEGRNQQPPWPWGTMPVDVEDLTDRQMFAIGIAENLKRRPLTAIEKAAALQRYIAEFGVTQAEAGELFGLTQSAVANLIRLQQLPDSVKDLVQEGKLAERQARALVSVAKLPAAKVEQIAAAVAAKPPAERDGELADRLENVLGNNNARELVDDRDEDAWAFPLDWADVSADIPACTDCPHRFRTGIRTWDSMDICMAPSCFDRKAAAWLELELKRVAAETGIPARGPGEKVTVLSFGHAARAAYEGKQPFLRWMVLPANDDRVGDFGDATGCPRLGLATIDRKAWEAFAAEAEQEHGRRRKAAEDAEASDDPQARVKHRKAILAMRKEKGEVIRNRYDVEWLTRSGVEALAPRLDLRGKMLRYLVGRVMGGYRSAFCINDWDADVRMRVDEGQLANEIEKELKAAKGPAAYDRQAKRRLALFLFLDRRGFATLDRKDNERTFLEIERDLGIHLPKGWNRIPIHHTEHNCWECGRFASQEGKILKAEAEDGWTIIEPKGNSVGTCILCPACMKKYQGKPARRAKSKRKAKRRKK